MLQYQEPSNLPSSLELPDSDDTPVDNEIQNLIPNLLFITLLLIWENRSDWFWGVDTGIYYNRQNFYVPIIPDGFLSLGVD